MSALNLTAGDGIAAAGCAWSVAYLLRWWIADYRQVRIAHAITKAVDQVVEAVKKI